MRVKYSVPDRARSCSVSDSILWVCIHNATDAVQRQDRRHLCHNHISNLTKYLHAFTNGLIPGTWCLLECQKIAFRFAYRCFLVRKRREFWVLFEWAEPSILG